MEAERKPITPQMARRSLIVWRCWFALAFVVEGSIFGRLLTGVHHPVVAIRFAVLIGPFLVVFALMMRAAERATKSRPVVAVMPPMDAREARARAQAREAMERLPAIERFICGRLILRQLNGRLNGRAIRVIYQYGPDGAAKLASAMAFQAYILLSIVPGIACSFISVRALLGYFVFLLLLTVLFLARVISAEKARRRWKASEGEPDAYA